MTLFVLRHYVPTMQMCLSTLVSRTQRSLSATSKGSRDFLWPREQADRPTGEADVLPFVDPNAYMRPRRDLIPHAHHCVVCAGGAPTASGFKAQLKHKCSGSHLAVQSGAIATPTGLDPPRPPLRGVRGWCPHRERVQGSAETQMLRLAPSGAIRSISDPDGT